MRVLITGATGFIGFAVACAFRRKGHDVVGLTRSQEGVKTCAAMEIEGVIADLSNLNAIEPHARHAEVIVHCAADTSKDKITRDLQAIEFFTKIASQSDLPKQFIYTSGCWLHGNTQTKVDEASPPSPLNLVTWRPSHEQKVLNAANGQFKTAVVRPGCVYGGSGGLTSYWFSTASAGTLEIVGKGENHWAMIHKDDLAEAYVLCAEKELSKVIVNVNDGSRLPIKTIAEAIAKKQSVPIKNLSPQEALTQYGPVAEGLSADQYISNERIMRLTGWRPHHLNFIHNLDIYYSAWKANV